MCVYVHVCMCECMCVYVYVCMCFGKNILEIPGSRQIKCNYTLKGVGGWGPGLNLRFSFFGHIFKILFMAVQ